MSKVELRNQVELRNYDNAWYQPGRSRLWQAAWFFLGLPVLRSSVMPSSALRVRLLRLFGARIGEGVVIKPSVKVKYPWNLSIGDHCWIGEACWIDNLAEVSLGSNICLSQDTYLCTGNHDWRDPCFGLRLRPIRIADGAWVGARATLLPGVTLGEGAIAAAGSVVSRSIPAMEIHAGNPAEFRKDRVIDEAGHARAQAPTYEPSRDGVETFS